MSDYWRSVWRQFLLHRLGFLSLIVIAIFCLAGIYAPLLASSKPLVVYFDGQWYFPLFRYLFFRGFFTKNLDIFYNLLMFTLPLFLLGRFILKKNRPLRRLFSLSILFLQVGLFTYLILRHSQDPSVDPAANLVRAERIQEELLQRKSTPNLSFKHANWHDDLEEMTSYAKLNTLVNYKQMKLHHKRLEKEVGGEIPSLWSIREQHEKDTIKRLQDIIAQSSSDKRGASYNAAVAELDYINEKNQWLEKKSADLSYEIMPLLSYFHWEDDAGGSQALNRKINWWHLTRTNRKDLVAALIFGIRISLSVGLIATAIALFIGIPIGALAGYYGGKIDIITCRLIEVWESMPTFFMLLMVVSFLQSKSIFLVIAVIGLFGWTSFSRYIRGEFFKQKEMAYVEACRALGFNDSRIIFSHLLPNSIPPVLTLIPFTIMAAITSEAGLSFLGLGEESSCSWGVLMDEGRTAFPSESYLLWPPAILLTLLLISIALVGDALRDAIDPRLQRGTV